MKKKVLIIIIVVILLIGIGLYFVFFNKKSNVSNDVIENYECIMIQMEVEDYTAEDNIYTSFVNNEQKEFTYKQIIRYNNIEAFNAAPKKAVEQESFLPQFEVDEDEMTVTYYRNIYFMYKENSIEEYIKRLEGKGYTCKKIEQ